MNAQTFDMFAGAVRDFADGPRIGGLEKLTEALMRRFAEKRLTLDQLSDRRMMNMTRRTLEKHCRKMRLAFPDYTPPDMRTRIEFVPSGDYLTQSGRHAKAVAEALEVAVTERDGIEQASIPKASFKEAKKKLERVGFSPIRMPKPKAVSNG